MSFGDRNDRSRFGKQQDSADLRPAAGRIPPHDLDAEAAVLSAILLSTEAFDDVSDLLQPEHFYSEANRRIFESIVDLQSNGRPVDVVTVATWLRDHERLQQVGGTPYLAQLTDSIPAVAHVAAHARVVREKWRVRKLIATCQRFAAEGYSGYGEVQEFIDQAEQAIFDIARVPENTAVRPVREAIHGAFDILVAASKRGEGITGVPTGFDRLDRKCAGLHKGDLYIVAGRPGMGKTAFVLNIAVNVASPRRVKSSVNDPLGSAEIEQPGWGVGFFSLEMPREQLASRLLAVEARVDVSRLRSGSIKPDDWNKLTDAAARVGRLPIWLDDTPAIGLLDLRAKIRRLKAEIGRKMTDGPDAQDLGLVVIDYLQLMQGRKDAASREQEISELSRGLKQLAKEMGVPVMALSQLNRSVETRTTKDKRPQLSDLRESGAIEQDADTIIFIYRDEYYFQESPDRGVAEIIIAKQRNGPTGTVKVRFTPEYTRFDNLASEDYEFDEFDEFAEVGS
ncbi:MAG TPA: replicative DNA helicase [Polyangiaceae bacterium]|nr:replicative DNA helicase [Polyangiaceae bacterium]